MREKKSPCVLATIYFKLDSDVIRDPEMEKLRSNVVGQIKDKKNLKISVRGYTCELGTKAHNDRLAVRRAKVVAKVLEEAGIHLAEVSGEGKCCYVSDELSRNRRSEVFVERESAAGAGLRCEEEQ
jgi:outer membrane protein OmpA-like peptidoglycan-associated protein